MKKFFGSFIDIRRGEISITLLMLFNIYLILFSYYLLKPARNSLFLTKLGPSELPLVYIFIAIVIIPITPLYSKASRSLKLNQLINITLIGLITTLFGLRWLMDFPYFWVPYLFYAWVSIYGILTTAQFWLLASVVYTATQAKRLFVLLGLGAIFGAWNGGEVTKILTADFNVSTENLLYYSMGILIISMFIIRIIFAMKKKVIEEQSVTYKRRVEHKESLSKLFGAVKRSRHLLLIVAIVSFTVLVATFLEFQLQAMSFINIQEKQQLTGFFGVFYGRLSLVSFIFQLLFSYRFLRVLGVGGVILFLPIGLLLGSLVMFFSVGLMAAVLLRGTDGSLRYSIDKTGRELLFLPIPIEIKKRTKVFIDMFVDRWSRGVAGGLLLLLIYLFNYDANPVEAVRNMSLVVIAFVAIWISIAFMMRKEYVNTFRKAIEKRQIDLSEVRTQINESSTIKTLINSLNSNNEREVDYALDMLTSVKNSSLIEPVKPLLEHSSPEIRKKAINVLLVQEDRSLIPDVNKLLDDSNIEVACDAMYFLNKHSDSNRVQMINIFLSHPNVKYRYTAVACIAKYGSSEQKQLIDETLIDSLINLQGEDGVMARKQVARALGSLNDVKFSKYIKRFLSDSSPEVVRETIYSVGKLKERDFVSWLLKSLSNREYRIDARNALAAFGVSILGTLNDYLIDEKVELSIRKNIPRVLCQIPDQKSVDILTANINKVDPFLKYYVVKALNNLRSQHPNLKFNETKVDEALINETKSYYEISQVLKLQKHSDYDSTKLLIKALEEKQDQNMERIFRILGLNYPPRDIYSAYQGIISNKKTLRASAIEFLDNLLKSSVKKYVFPILDEVSSERIIHKGRELFGIKMNSRSDALLYLIKGRDNWLKACAVYNSIDNDSPELRKAVQEVVNDNDPVVRETVALVLQKKNS